MEQLKKELIRLGVAYEDALKRFLEDETFYREMLIKFLSDEHMAQLEQYLAQNDIQNAFQTAHTLKGLCANFGFQNLLQPLIPLVDILRNNTLPADDTLLSDLKEQYRFLCTTIEKYKTSD